MHWTHVFLFLSFARTECGLVAVVPIYTLNINPWDGRVTRVGWVSWAGPVGCVGLDGSGRVSWASRVGQAGQVRRFSRVRRAGQVRRSAYLCSN